jgi:hypothetical protein
MLILNGIADARGWSPIQHMIVLAAELLGAEALIHLRYVDGGCRNLEAGHRSNHSMVAVGNRRTAPRILLAASKVGYHPRRPPLGDWFSLTRLYHSKREHPKPFAAR